MRILTLLSFAAIFAAQSANAQNPVQNQRISLESVSGVYAPAQSPVAKKAVSDIMRPAKEQIFYRNDKNDGWAETPGQEYTYTYDEKGRVKTKLSYNEKAEVANKKYERYTYEYDENGNETLVLLEYSGDNETWKGSWKIEKTWDNVVKGLQTGAMMYEYSVVTKQLTKMSPENCFRTEITRDDKGRVTLYVNYRYKDKKTEYINQRITPTYDEATGHPSSVMFEDQVWDNATNDYTLGELKKFSNLKWHECDDQFVNINDNFRMGTNRATEYRFGYRGVDAGDYVITYGEKYPEYVANYTYLDGSGSDVMTNKLIDDNGSYYYYDEAWWDKNGDGEKGNDEMAYSKYVYYYNEKGVKCGEEQWGCGYGSPIDLNYAHKDVYTYDAAYDYPTEIVAYSFDFFNKVLEDGTVNYTPSQRTVYTEFSKVGEVDAINTVKANAEGFTTYSLFDLQGRCVEKGAMNNNIGSGKHGVFILQMSNGSETKSVRIAR